MPIADLSRYDDVPIVMLIGWGNSPHLGIPLALQVTRLADTTGFDGLGTAVDRAMSRR
jgi:hypothetical protein